MLATLQVIGEEYSRLKEECDLGFKQLRAKMCLEYLGFFQQDLLAFHGFYMFLLYGFC